MFGEQTIDYSYNEHVILKGVNLRLQNGVVTGLIGPSGGGKSTLLKILGGVLSCNGLRVGLGGCAAEDVSLMFQEGALFDSLTVFDNIAFPLTHGRVPSSTLGSEELERVYDSVIGILAKVGLERAAYKYPAQLSGGMRRRISLARALVAHPSLVLLDDPTAGLDPVASSVIMNLIVQIQHEYKPTMLIVSHDLRRLLPVCDRILALFEGHLCFDGTLDELKKQSNKPLTDFVSCRFDLS